MFRVQTAFAASPPNAWQISDTSTSAGTALTYFTNLTVAQQLAATNAGGGWQYTVNARFLTNFGGPKTMAMAYGVGNKRWLVWLDLNGSGDLTAELEGRIVYTLTTNGTGSTLYHTHEVIYDPSTARASYLFDGQVMTNNWPGSGFALTPGQVLWGAANSAGQGRMNFHSAKFDVTGLSIVANYDAGTQNNPTVAPNPTTIGWGVNAGASTFSTDVSPDTALLPVVTSLSPDAATNTTVRLNGQANPSGSPATAWFEWGTDTNYGNLTAIQNIGQGTTASNITATLTNLSSGVDYHYRIVASNSFGAVVGQDWVFNISFISMAVGTPVGAGACVAWGDYDRDGRLDIEWRRWLNKHHASSPGVWLVFYKDHTGVKSILYEDSVRDALCFGWIDSLIKRLDHDRYVRKFTPRKPASKWSDLNRKRWAELKASGLLTSSGLAAAPTNNTYAPRPTIPALPRYVARAFRTNPKAWNFFASLAPGQRRRFVVWIHLARRAETRQKRIRESIALLEKSEKLGLK